MTIYRKECLHLKAWSNQEIFTGNLSKHESVSLPLKLIHLIEDIHIERIVNEAFGTSPCAIKDFRPRGMHHSQMNGEFLLLFEGWHY